MERRRFLALAAAGFAVPAARAAVPPPPSRFIEDLTWIELRDAVRSGAIVAIVPTGGTEANGPQLAIGKHNLIVRHCAGAIAQRLGNALVAPVLAYVPEGNFTPPSENMTLPGTLGVSEPTFAAVLRDTARSLALSGFRLICFLGDHGLSQRAQTAVAKSLSAAWRKSGIHVANLERYYTANAAHEWLWRDGYAEPEIGAHAGLIDSAELMAVAPDEVRRALLSPPGWPQDRSGGSGDPSRATPALGETLLERKIAAAVAETRELLAAMGIAGGD